MKKEGVPEGWEEGVVGGIKRRRAGKRDTKKVGVLEGWEEGMVGGIKRRRAGTRDI